MIMRLPTPFSASKLAGDNGPLKPDGSDFPCKFGYDAEGASNIMPLGSKQELAFTGGATHGGGSCQVSITYDKAPTANSVFKVIHSIVGGCPARNTEGNIGTSATAEDPDKYAFKIPETLPSGDAVLAWTWFNKVGNREMYMNCAPIKLTGGSGTEQASSTNGTQMPKLDMAAFEALPDMFVANIGNGCTTKDSTDLKFEDPGESVEVLSNKALAGPVGSCGQYKKSSSSSDKPDSTTTSPDSTSASDKPESSSSSQKPDSTSASDKPESSSSKKPNSNSSSDSSSSPTEPKAESSTPVGGAFFTTQASKPKPDAATAPKESASPSSQAAPASPASNNTGAAASGSKASDSTSAGSPCSPEGIWNCINGKSYQQCGSGTWSVVMPLAAGTKCNAGISASIKVVAMDKRHVRFSNAHLRRHIHSKNFN
ncbi:hypothetical protein K3495_g3885 [Podosphaera aphanis]|nr:hypothetical protein K3495_g3885 [Podosphaera aphanis]